MHPLTNPIEPHFVHLSWAVRRLTPIQARYIKMFYGAGVLHQLEGLEHRRPRVRERDKERKQEVGSRVGTKRLKCRGPRASAAALNHSLLPASCFLLRNYKRPRPRLKVLPLRA
jgi:hypothetical protein